MNTVTNTSTSTNTNTKTNAVTITNINIDTSGIESRLDKIDSSINSLVEQANIPDGTKIRDSINEIMFKNLILVYIYAKSLVLLFKFAFKV